MMEGEKQGRVFYFDEVHNVIQAPLNKGEAGTGGLVAEADLLLLKVQGGAVEGHGEQFHKLVLQVLKGGGKRGEWVGGWGVSGASRSTRKGGTQNAERSLLPAGAPT